MSPEALSSEESPLDSHLEVWSSVFLYVSDSGIISFILQAEFCTSHSLENCSFEGVSYPAAARANFSALNSTIINKIL